MIEFLGQYVTENKRSRMAEVLEFRTRFVTVVLEDIYQPHNASACLRSCDCLGIQDVHVVEGRNDYRPNPDVAMGSAKWLTLVRHAETASCIAGLKESGYRIMATTPNEEGAAPADLSLDRPIALLFGTEEEGLSDEALSLADGAVRLPMYGFTRSFNISVTVAVTLSRLVERLHGGEGPGDWRLAPEAREELLLEWYRKIVTSHRLLEEREFGP